MDVSKICDSYEGFDVQSRKKNNNLNQYDYQQEGEKEAEEELARTKENLGKARERKSHNEAMRATEADDTVRSELLAAIEEDEVFINELSQALDDREERFKAEQRALDEAELRLEEEIVEAEAALNEAMDIDSNNYDTLVSQAEDKDVSVVAHSRTRVIGGPTTAVSAHTYTYKQWPTSESGFADGGAVVLVSWSGSDGEWTARVTGSFADFGTFLQDNATSPSFFRSQRGTKYGPF